MSQHSHLLHAAAASILCFGLAAPALAAHGAFVPGTNGVGQMKTTAVTTKHKLQGTYIDSNAFVGVALPADTFVPVGTPASLNCTNAAGCTMTAELMAQIAANGIENPWAICISVDGAMQYCPWTSQISAVTSIYVTENTRYNFAVPVGAHTMQLVVYSVYASSLGAYEATYRLYKP